jgi:hypothetical protein
MPNDQFGRSISVGDTVIIKGEVTKVLEDPNFVNCTVKLAQQMPPAGTETNLQLNTAQLEKTGGSKGGDSKGGGQQAKSPQPQHQEQTTQPPQHSGAKK